MKTEHEYIISQREIVQEKKIYALNGMEIVSRGDAYFVRYDAGAHQVYWREDQISREELEQIKSGKTGQYDVFLALQKRIISLGEDPYKSNWIPLGPVGE